MTKVKGVEEVKRFLSEKLRTSVEKIPLFNAQKIQEIRLRLEKNLTVCILDKEYFLTERGELDTNLNTGIKVERSDIEYTFNIACQYSLHSFQKELSQGFITVQGGNRIGLCGTAVIKNNAVETIKDISSINIRVARQIIGCADEIYSALFCTELQSVLIVGSPTSGKTTILRDLCRQLGQVHKTSIIDERNELSATINGSPQNDVGICSDVFNSYPKSEGIMTAIRVMSPKIIVCDEIGGEPDIVALENAINAGVKIVATAHAGSIKEAENRLGLSRLIKAGAFDVIVSLGNGVNIGKIMKIHRIGEKYD